jgi:glucose/arabinose dehydrogenase
MTGDYCRYQPRIRFALHRRLGYRSPNNKKKVLAHEAQFGRVHFHGVSMLRIRWFISLPLLFTLLLGIARPARGDVTLLPLASGLSLPVDIANAGDASGRLFIAEQSGNIRIIQNGTLLVTPFLNLQSVVNFGGERGLLGLAFHPQYAANGRFYVYYTSKPFTNIGDGDIVIARYQRSAANANLADSASAQIILTIPHPTNANHNGGALRFGPDGYLYVGVGDGGSGGDPPNNAQNRNVLLGKILRLDVAGAGYAIPPTNPFIGIANVRPEIWAYGVRNPFRFSFDRATGDFYIGDVGQNAREEVNRQAAGFAGGANYGWKIFEGLNCYLPPPSLPNCTPVPADYVPPIFDYTHAVGQSITGGYVYRGSSTPDMLGKYLFGDFVQSKLFFSPGNATANFTQLTLPPEQVSTFGEGEKGELYLANYSTGTIRSFSSSTDSTPDAFAFFPVAQVAHDTTMVSNTVKITGLGVNANISVTGGEYSVGCTASFTTVANTIANNATVCVRHVSANAPKSSVTTTLTVGGVAANFSSTTRPLVAVRSRKMHGATGPFDLTIDTSLVAPNITVEPRTIGSGHLIAFQFSDPVAFEGSATVTPIGSASATRAGNEVLVTLTAIPDNQRVTVSLTGVNLANFGTTSAQASIGFLVGDVNNTRSVDGADTSLVKARAGQTASPTNFMYDFNASGTVNASDISAVKARVNRVLPP